MDPPRANPKQLNKALLFDIASNAVEKQMTSADRVNKVAALYMLDKRFNRSVMRHLEECDSVELSGSVVSFHGRKEKARGELDPKRFTALVEHSGLVIPTLTLGCDFCELRRLKLTGVESLKLLGTTSSCRLNLDHLVRFISENKSSLKALLGVPKPLFGRLPCGLQLDEFSPCSVQPHHINIPTLNTKVFKFDAIADDMKILLSFMRTVNADEIHLRIHWLVPGGPMKPFGARPANHRTKKLRVETVDERVSSLDFGRIFREVAVFFPKLECFELVQKKRFDTGYTYEKFTSAVDAIVASFERALKEADTAPYKVHLKTRVWYSGKNQVMPEETDFKCGLLKSDLPATEEAKADKQHSYFVKETSSADGKNLRVDCEIVEGTKSFDGSEYADNEIYEHYCG